MLELETRHRNIGSPDITEHPIPGPVLPCTSVLILFQRLAIINLGYVYLFS
jgi:hypothetical protein